MASIKTLRVLHIGNIANNAFNITKALRERCDIEADCYTNHYDHYISQPEWEDADIDPVECYEDKPVDWSTLDLRGYQRPDWYFETKNDAIERYHYLKDKDVMRCVSLIQNADISKHRIDTWKNMIAGATDSSRKKMISVANLGLGSLLKANGRCFSQYAWNSYLQREFNRLCRPPHISKLESQDFATIPAPSYLKHLFSKYDIIQTYGAWELSYPIRLTPSIPRVTLEHGTMWAFALENSAFGRWAALAYKSSSKNIITNANAIHSIRKLGLKNCVFIPHPVDDTKFSPQSDPEFRNMLLTKHNATHIFLAPARHNWYLKGNDLIIHGMADLIKKAGAGPKLFLFSWGQEMERSKKLIEQLKIVEHIVWLPPLPKRLLARYMNAADAVLDQFLGGSFGTVTAEALACAKPVLLFYNTQDHQWCLPQPPPVFNIRAAGEITETLLKIINDPQAAERKGRDSLEWFQEYHSLDVVVQRHLAVYREIANKSMSIFVPAEKITLGSLMMSKKINSICCVTAALQTDADVEACLTGFNGVSRLEILDVRLRSVDKDVLPILFTSSPSSALRQEAERLHWAIMPRGTGLRALLKRLTPRLAWRFLRAKVFWHVNLNYPFIDREATCAWLRRCGDTSDLFWGASALESNPYVPAHIMSRGLAVRIGLFFLMMKNFGADKYKSVYTLVAFAKQLSPEPLPKGFLRLNANNFEEFDLNFNASNFQIKDLKALPPIRALLHQAMRSSMAKNPHKINETLNALEIEDGHDVLLSLPTFAALNMTSRCNAHCVFCSIQPGEQKFKDSITLDDIKKMTWLRYVSTFAIWGGIGDSLVNREFLPIFQYLRGHYPHLRMTLSTNGIAMTDAIVEALAGELVSCNVSLNAATRDTWERLMRSKGFDNVCAAFKKLSTLRPDKNTPAMSLSMVLTKSNLHEAVDFVDLAHNLGADQVIFAHFVPTTLVGRRDLASEESLYFDKERSDDYLKRAKVRAEQLDLTFTGPELFSTKTEHICFGSRSAIQQTSCQDPWKTCYLTVDEDGRRQMIFCCSGFYYEIEYDKSNMTEDEFLEKIWNHPAARYFRRTANKSGANPICGNCMTVDRFDPNNKEIYTISEKITPFFSRLQRQFSEEGTLCEDIENGLKKAMAGK